MTSSKTSVPTAHASRYLQQLCKHWSHKFAVEFTPDQGVIPFGEGSTCRLSAGADALQIVLEAPEQQTQAKLQDVVFSHLKRFAFREDWADPVWGAA